MHTGPATEMSRLMVERMARRLSNSVGHLTSKSNTTDSCCHMLMSGRSAPLGTLRFRARNAPNRAKPRKTNRMETTTSAAFT